VLAMDRQEVLRANHSVFVAYGFPEVLWTSFVDGREGHFSVPATLNSYKARMPLPARC
jgi:hypothetical protein